MHAHRSCKSAARLSFSLAATLCALAPSSPVHAAVYTYLPTASITDQWTAGTHWSATPVSASNATLIFGPAGNYTGSLSNINKNDFSSSFNLNVLTLRGNSGGATVAIKISGSPLFFSGTTPTINLDATGSNVTYTVQSTIMNNSSVTITGDGTAVFDFSGSIGGTAAITKSGTSTVTFSGSNSYTGGTTITGGLINFQSLSNLSSKAITLDGGGLQWNTFNTLDISSRLNALGAGGGTLDIGSNAVTLATAITGSGALTKAGTGTLTFAAANTYAGGTTITKGLVNFTAAADFGTGNITLNGGGLQWATGNTVDISPALNTLGTGGGTFNTNGNDVTLATAITGTGPVTKAGAGTLTLSGENTYTGTTTISGGTLQVGSGGIAGSSVGNIVNNAALVFNRSDDSSFPGKISGTGSFTKLGAGTLTLSGASTYTAGTQINAGTLSIGSNAALGTGPIAFNGGALQSSGDSLTLANAVSLNADGSISGTNALTLTGAFTLTGFKSLTVSNTAQTTISGVIRESSPSILIKLGAGELQLTGANTYTAGTYIGAGTVRINNTTGSAFGTGAVTVAAGATLAGNGSFTGALQLNGTYSPGNSPGTASPGATNWAGGAAYIWELNNASDAPGAKGVTYDWMNIGGALAIDSTSGNTFTIYVHSLDAGNAAGVTPGFANGTTYHWIIASATNVTDFGADKFLIDTSGFSNDPADAGGFTITQIDNDLVLTYTAVPESGTWGAITGVGLLGLALLRRNRRAAI